MISGSGVWHVAVRCVAVLWRLLTQILAIIRLLLVPFAWSRIATLTVSSQIDVHVTLASALQGRYGCHTCLVCTELS